MNPYEHRSLHRNLLEPHPANRKTFDPARLDELRADIAEHGVLDDLLVRRLPGRDGSDGQPTHQILSGERRWRASEGTAAAAALPCKVLAECSDLQALELVAAPNIQREDLHPLDEAAVFEQLLAERPAWMAHDAGAALAASVGAAEGYSLEQLTARLHKRPAYVRARLRLLALTPTAQHAYRDGEFGTGSALQIARLAPAHQDELVLALLQDAAHGAPWTAEAISHTVQSRYMLRLAQAPFALDDDLLLPAAGACTACPKRSGANPDLFGDVVDGDACTDAACFSAKCEALTDREIAAARAKGWTVIEGDEARRLLPREDGTVRGYLRLDRPSEFALSKRPLGELLGEEHVRDVALIVLPRPGGMTPALVRVMPTGTVRQVLHELDLLRSDDPGADKPRKPPKPADTDTQSTPAAQPPAPEAAAAKPAPTAQADGDADADDQPATLKLGAICKRLGFVLSAAFVADTLGVPPARTEGAAKLYTERDFECICGALIDHVDGVLAGTVQEAAA